MNGKHERWEFRFEPFPFKSFFFPCYIASAIKIVEAVEKSRNTSLSRFLIGIGIPMLGVQAARTLEQYFDGSWEEFEKAAREEFFFSHIAGISHVLEQNIHRWIKTKPKKGCGDRS